MTGAGGRPAGRALLDAGAPVVFVAGVVARDEIEALVEALGRAG